MKYLSAISITLAAFMFACTSLSNGQDILSITMVAGAPSTYNGKVISLSGWMTMRAEDHNLWETRSDHEKWNTKKCVSLKNYFNTAQLRKAVDGKMVVVTGIFHMDADHDPDGRVLLRLGSCNKFAIEFTSPDAVKVVR